MCVSFRERRRACAPNRNPPEKSKTASIQKKIARKLVVKMHAVDAIGRHEIIYPAVIHIYLPIYVSHNVHCNTEIGIIYLCISVPSCARTAINREVCLKIIIICSRRSRLPPISWTEFCFPRTHRNVIQFCLWCYVLNIIGSYAVGQLFNLFGFYKSIKAKTRFR